VLFKLQLLLSWLVIFVSTLAEMLDETDEPLTSEDSVKQTTFGLSVVLSLVLALDSIVSPKTRWQQLRGTGHALEGIIWLYRTRVGVFEIDVSRRHSVRPELQLQPQVAACRRELLEGGMAQTALLRRYPARVYTHFQYSGRPTVPSSGSNGGAASSGCDDHQSPCPPTKYIELRLNPMLAFYQRRIPKYTRISFQLKLTLVLLGIASSILAHVGLISPVVLITSAAAMLTSWGEFTAATSKSMRYSHAVSRIMDHLDWWSSLSNVEKANKVAITRLVLVGEQIITEERQSWTSSATSDKNAERLGIGDAKEDEPAYEPGSPKSKKVAPAEPTDLGLT